MRLHLALSATAVAAMALSPMAAEATVGELNKPVIMVDMRISFDSRDGRSRRIREADSQVEDSRLDDRKVRGALHRSVKST